MALSLKPFHFAFSAGALFYLPWEESHGSGSMLA